MATVIDTKPSMPNTKRQRLSNSQKESNKSTFNVPQISCHGNSPLYLPGHQHVKFERFYERTTIIAPDLPSLSNPCSIKQLKANSKPTSKPQQKKSVSKPKSNKPNVRTRSKTRLNSQKIGSS
mmetsp:Transcript_14800/g.16432  ORF Transcript_14800/g.16432 Transcript_14800/m.16432 type:complete len:123 (+) Transcript_14800:547-915(+)